VGYEIRLPRYRMVSSFRPFHLSMYLPRKFHQSLNCLSQFLLCPNLGIQFRMNLYLLNWRCLPLRHR
jgi:hypothetical protein